MKQILIISHYDFAKDSGHRSALSQFVNEFNSEYSDFTIQHCSIHQLVFVVQDQTTQVLLNGVDIADKFDVLMIRNMNFYLDYAAALVSYAKHNNVHVINAADLAIPAYGKISQAFLFAHNGIPTPDTMSATANTTLQTYVLNDKTNYPIIVKHNDGIKGLNNYLVQSVEELTSILAETKQGFVVQPYIKNDGELRILTFGEQDPIIFKKQASKGTHLNNTSRGGNANSLKADDIDPEVLAAGRKAAHLTGREIGGVDVLLASDGRYFILEVNHTAALASGTFLAEKRAAFANYLANVNKESL